VIKFLKGEAEGIYNSMSSKKQKDYKEIKRKIVKELTPVDAAERAFAEFISANQRPEETASSYGRRLKKVGKRSWLTKERKLVERYVKSVSQEVMMQLSSHDNPKSMKEAMNRASQIETRLEDRKHKELTTINSVSSTPRYKNPVQDCRDIPLKSALKFSGAQTKVDSKEIVINQDRDNSKVKCYGCGELGQYQNRCFASCTKCSKFGPSAEFCRSVSKQKN